METKSRGGFVSSPALKFAIGLIASLCAVLFPRLIAALTTQSGTGTELVFLTVEFMAIAAVFSVLVGLVVMILEWRIARKPGDTFMTTLGIPAILASALSANQNAQVIQQAAQVQKDLTSELQSVADIPTIGRLTDREPSAYATLLPTLIETRVYAAQSEPSQRRPPSNLGIRVVEPLYRIVLDRVDQEARAKERMTQLRTQLSSNAPPIRVERSPDGKGFLVVAGDPRPRAEALLEAIRLKRTYALSPALMEVAASKR